MDPPVMRSSEETNSVFLVFDCAGTHLRKKKMNSYAVTDTTIHALLLSCKMHFISVV